MREVRDPKVRVFVIWEPVLVTDWHAPSAGTLALIPDLRATQYWDRQRRLSAEIRRADAAKPDGVVWDFAAVYAPGARWDGTLPAPRFSGRPVVDVIDDVRHQLP